MRPLDKYQEKHQRRPRWQGNSPKLAKKKNNSYHMPEETVNNTIDMIDGDVQGEYEIKCL